MQTVKDNFKLVVYPKTKIPFTSIPLSEKEVIAICDEIYAQIMKHVDNVDFVTIEYDTSYHCLKCGYIAQWNDKDHYCVAED